MQEDLHSFFASCIPGTERALCEELRELGVPSVRLNRGGIPFRGPWEEGWRACLQSRIAQRILVLLNRFPAPDEDSLYRGVRDVEWGPFIGPSHTLAVDAVSRSSALRHSGHVALKAKDAIVDQVRAAVGARPSVDRGAPDVRVFVYLLKDKCSLYLDMSGDSLHLRGYRLDAGAAPLRETLAAAILRLSGWDRTTPLIDPLCGSGTIPIEAALWAANRSPGLYRERFGFERWANFDDAKLRELRLLEGRLRGEAKGSSPRIQAADRDPEVLDLARKNARRAGVKPAFRERSVMEWDNGGHRMQVVTNPPYGQRLEKDPRFASAFAAAVTRWHHCRVAVLAGSPDYKAAIPLPAEEQIPLKNGDLPCELLIYEVP